MKYVWLLTKHDSCDGFSILGVYEDYGDAQAECDTREQDEDISYAVEKWEVLQ